MKQYLDLLSDIMENGIDKSDRTGVGTRSVFGRQLRFDLSKGFPAVTTKKLAFKAMVSELLWFLEGSTDERRLCEILHGTRDPEKKTIWSPNAEADYWKPKAKYTGDLGPVYGHQWRKWKKAKHIRNIVETSFNNGNFIKSEQSVVVWEKVDQLARIIDKLKNDPNDRRMILSAWNVAELDEMALPACHCFSQFYVANGKLSCQLYQRSCDVFLGVPLNIASYSLLTHMLAQIVGLEVGEFIWTGGDTHIYLNHLDQVKEQLTRAPMELPKLWINTEVKDIDSFKMSDFRLENYNPMDSIKAEMAV